MYGMCSHCLCDAHFTETGHDEHGRRFKLYFCHKCKQYTRRFDAPMSEREVVDEALVEDALSEPNKAKQLRMFAKARVMD